VIQGALREGMSGGRAGAVWLGLLLVALLALPWHRGAGLGAGPAASALMEALGGRVWLLPPVLIAATLAGCR
jgi:iron(III) transport system permease protein